MLALPAAVVSRLPDHPIRVSGVLLFYTVMAIGVSILIWTEGESIPRNERQIIRPLQLRTPPRRTQSRQISLPLRHPNADPSTHSLKPGRAH
jgi:hypothetical protein